MNWTDYKKQFELKCDLKKIPQVQVDVWITYARCLWEKSFPIIFDKAHLSKLLGYECSLLDKIIHRPGKFYRSFSISKRNGEFRELNAPYPTLNEIQKWILVNILEKKKVSPYAKAYIKRKKILDNIRFHTNHEVVIKLDVDDFFGSIHKSAIIKIFNSMGYSRQLSFDLASLCCLKKSLPQGAPTSPCLSNIFCEQIDARLSKYLKKLNLCYTRYSDDITISGNISDVQIPQIMSFCKYLLSDYGLNLNEKKTKVLRQHQKQYVTGAVVNKKMSADIKLKKDLRQQMYYIQKYGLNSHMVYKRIDQQNYVYHLMGKIQWVLALEKSNQEFLRYKEHLTEILKNLKF
ncbi:reverse transcriptase family protein [Fibrobacter sp.]|uniref:reverse transcriptase family protein n=1 Tax=Fibrobacter sp. TaxID=35828 RepID=UPI0025BB7D9C|nr:reverse transcriptase family protein [Fibrobacter sp.]MBR3072247.1 RNA-directed DNA polymerase [Fibrobacter sp.]